MRLVTLRNLLFDIRLLVAVDQEKLISGCYGIMSLNYVNSLLDYVCYFLDADNFCQNPFARNRITFDIPELFETLKIICCDYSVE